MPGRLGSETVEDRNVLILISCELRCVFDSAGHRLGRRVGASLRSNPTRVILAPWNAHRAEQLLTTKVASKACALSTEARRMAELRVATTTGQARLLRSEGKTTKRRRAVPTRAPPPLGGPLYIIYAARQQRRAILKMTSRGRKKSWLKRSSPGQIRRCSPDAILIESATRTNGSDRLCQEILASGNAKAAAREKCAVTFRKT